MTKKKTKSTFLLNKLNEISDDISYDLERFFIDGPRILWRTFKNATFDKFKYGFNPRECWSLDLSIAEYVLPRLKYLKKVKHGTPCDMFPKNYLGSNLSNTDNKKCEKIEAAAEKKWDEIMDKMILSFELIVKDEWDTIEEYKVQQKKIEEGLNLFAKHFRSLWD